MKNALKPLDKSILIPLELTAASLAKDAAIHKKMSGSGRRTLDLASPLSDLASCLTTLIILNEEMNYIIKVVKSLEESGLLIKGVR